MTNNSKLCKILSKYTDGAWMNILENDHHGITYKIEGDLAIFNYGIGADFYDPVVQEARGIIINTKTCEVVCWPFRKFGKYSEGYADSINWDTARVQEKLDGSIVKLWWNALKSKWQFSTNSMIDAANAIISNSVVDSEYNDQSFLNLIESAENFKNIDYEILDQNKTYIFELCGPGNRVIVPYKNMLLYHIGTRSNLTGEEFNEDIGIIKPTEYGLHNLDECLDYVSRIFNSTPNGIVDSCEHEGFVVVDNQYNRIKIKSPIYLQLHGIVNNSFLSKRSLVNMLWDKTINVASICKDFPELAHIIKWYDFQVEEFKNRSNAIIDITKKLYNRFDGNRKEVALRVKDHRLSWIAFIAFKDLSMTPSDIYKYIGIDKITKWIPDYPIDDMSYMLRSYMEENQNE